MFTYYSGIIPDGRAYLMCQYVEEVCLLLWAQVLPNSLSKHFNTMEMVVS